MSYAFLARQHHLVNSFQFDSKHFMTGMRDRHRTDLVSKWGDFLGVREFQDFELRSPNHRVFLMKTLSLCNICTVQYYTNIDLCVGEYVVICHCRKRRIDQACEVNTSFSGVTYNHVFTDTKSQNLFYYILPVKLLNMSHLYSYQ